MRRALQALALVAIGLPLTLLAAGYLYQVFGSQQDLRRLAAGHELREVNGHSLFIHCVGKGQTTVVIEPGAGSWSAHWRHIQADLADFTRICTYDRAGLGLSQPPRRSMTGQAYARDLHDLLQLAGEPPPYILVGHSMGGYLTRMYATLYPEDVAGMVLADAAHEDQWQRFPSSVNALMEQTLGQMGIATWMARFGLMRAMGLPAQGFASEQQEADIAAIMMTTDYWPALNAEFITSMTSLPDAVRATPDLGELPLLVVSAGNSAHTYCAADGSTGVDCGEAQAVWNQMQRDLLKLSTNSRQVIVPGATHAIYVDGPDALVHHIGEFTNSVVAGAN